MKKFIPLFLVFSVAATCLILSSFVWAKEEFQVRLFPGAGPGSQKARKLIISVESYTSTEEVYQLVEIFNRKGHEPFRNLFHSMNKGEVLPTGGRGRKIILHAAQEIQTDKGRKILLIAESQSWDLDSGLRYDSRFPYMIIELNINKKGRGTGKIYVSADIKLTGQGTIEMASYNSPPKQIFGVSVIK